MKDFQKDFLLKGDSNLHDDEPIGPLERARENLEAFADSLIMQDSLKQMLEWMSVLENILDDPDVSDLELAQTKEELKLMEQAWCILADSLYEKGISA
ncbi:MAG: hypothetical protein CMB77_05000 [Euryarchaeota archaeon]|nr:hypothetical protein [Euryarchaeota archaeon]|tara:strand:- start:880 stop:1173 length:294 start_codon:yes stop_codon:yes gene_type:complete